MIAWIDLGADSQAGFSPPLSALRQARLRRERDVNPASAESAADRDDLPIVDEAHLAAFTDGDEALEDELGDLYLNTTKGYLKRMAEALRDKRPWSAEAHALKGASANIGARRAAALAKRAEFAPPTDALLAELRAAVEEVGRFFAGRKP
jgi:HPt (histidine-containing phosphotransfer) domain-containing protein